MRTFSCALLLFFLINYLAKDHSAWAKLDILSMECITYDRQFVNFSQCQVVKTENSQSLLNARANLIQRATAIKIRFKILRKTNKKFQTFFTDQWADICDLLGNEANKGNVFWDMFSAFILKNTNVNHSCPYEPQEIHTKDFILCNQVGDILPFPKGFYRSELTIFANSAKRCMIRVDGEKS